MAIIVKVFVDFIPECVELIAFIFGYNLIYYFGTQETVFNFFSWSKLVPEYFVSPFHFALILNSQQGKNPYPIKLYS